MNTNSNRLSYSKRRPMTLCAGVLIVHCFVVADVSFLTEATCSSLLTTKPSTTSTRVESSDKISFHVLNLRGGSERNRNGKLRSMWSQRAQTRKQASMTPQRLWQLGIEGWKFAVEKIAFKNTDLEIMNTRNHKFDSRPATTTQKIHQSKNTTNIDQKAPNESEDPNIEVRKARDAPRLPHYSPFKMYAACMGIVTLWILTGTFFYSHANEWPLPQSFFYAVDAGMSIGFCTDVAETKLVSKAFTILYIIMGASVVGGALALFIQDIVEGVVERERKNNRLILTKEYELLLGKEAFDELDVTHDGCLTKDEFGKLLKTTAFRSSSSKALTDEEIEVLWTKFDRVEDGAIRFEEIEGTYRGIEGLLDSLLTTNATIPHTSALGKNIERNPLVSKLRSLLSCLASPLSSFLGSLWTSENRIYYVFLAWVMLGIVWGMMDQGWDPITATHFAISALATGGLTAPPVNSDGILPAEPAIFCGLYCLFGIPLMAITFGHFARALVSDHVAEMEQWALTKPITATHYEIAKQYLINFRETKTTKDWYANYPVKSIFGKGRRLGKPSSMSSWRGLRLSDFIVLQIFRQGRISVETIDILRKEFELLDKDQTGLLTLEDATSTRESSSSTMVAISAITANDRSGPYRMVALDLDGTLLQSNHQLADEQAEYLRSLFESGFRVCIATGRAAPSVYEIVKKLALPEPTPVVCSNGARGFLLSYDDADKAGNENKQQEELFYTPLYREAVTKTIQVAKKLGYFVQYYIDDGIYANPITDSHHKMIKEYERLTGSSLETVDDDFDRFLGTQDDNKLPSKLLVRCEKNEFAACHPTFVDLLKSSSNDETERLAHIVAAYNQDLDWFLEILHPDVNKGRGLRNMCQKLEIPMNDVIAMGDGTNDIEFLQMSGLGIAMNNAHESLRKVASYTMEWTNDEHGVMKTLEQLKTKGELYSNN